MTKAPSAYAVGRGRPPLHTRFKKGQSGNSAYAKASADKEIHPIRRSFSVGGPSGKPGPAKLAKQRFERALYAALEGSEAALELSKPDNVIAGIARRMALDAAAGRASALRLVLSLLDAESEKSAGAEDDAAEQLFTGAELLSLLQGKMQGNEKQWLEEILWPDAREKPARGDDDARKERIGEPAQAASARGGNGVQPFSLVQGKTQGSAKKPTEQICPALEADRTTGAGRAQLMTGTAPIHSSGRVLFGGNTETAAAFPLMPKGAAADCKAAVWACARAHGA
jgi:hypothetical protein